MLSLIIMLKGQFKIMEQHRQKSNNRFVFIKRGDSIIAKYVKDIFSVRGSVPKREWKSYPEIREQVKNEVAKRIAGE
ncbi:MAG: hypothetical protein GF353_28840 [Candidatus Lokiarchaeota archaeon]|nr:hypothetical protein [Candidatus Lokiarchaeota archaeon]